MKKLILVIGLLIIGVGISEGQTAYITNEQDSTVSVINVATNTVTYTIPVGNNPIGVSVSPNGNKVYIGNWNDAIGGTTSVINTNNNYVTATITTGISPSGLQVSPDGNKLYVTNGNDNTLSVINTSSDSVVATIPVYAPYGLVVSPDGSKVYVAAGNNKVVVINTSSDSVFATIPVYGPDGLVVSPDGSKVYVTSDQGNSVSVINALSYSIYSTITGFNKPIGISITPDGTKIFVANNGSNSVSVINTVTDSIIDTIAVGIYPFGLSVTPDGTKVLVANHGSNTVSVIKTSNDSVITTINVGHAPAAFGNFISIYPQHEGIATYSNETEEAFICPNPFTSQTVITFSEEQKNTILYIRDVLGNVIQQSTINGKQYSVDMRDHAKGIYFVQIMSLDKLGMTNVINKKIVVE